MDCIVVGYHDADLQGLMAARESIRDVSGAYRQMLGSVFRIGGKWLHHAQLLNSVLKDVTHRNYRLHPMELPSLAVCHLTSYLAARGFDVEMINFLNADRSRLAALLQEGPRAVAVTTPLYVESAPVADVVRLIRRYSADTCVVAGGPYILGLCSLPNTEAQDRVLDGIGADLYIVEAQGESTLARVLTGLRSGDMRGLERVPNLVIRERAAETPDASHEAVPRGRYRRTPRRLEDNDMNENAIDWGRVPAALCRPTAQMILSRSCPFACSFCRYPALAGPLRLTGVETVAQQLQQLHDGGARTLIFADDTPNVPEDRFKAILNMMVDHRFRLDWFANFRCSHADDEMYELLKASGCRGVFLGIESGDQTMLDHMNKRATVEQYREGIRKLKHLGILTYTSFLVGFPGETSETVQNTLRFLSETEPDYYQVHLYYHSRYVPIQREARRFGLHGGDYSWRHATMDWETACDWIEHIRDNVTGSVLSTSYLSSFWWIAYLFGLGVSLVHIRAFMAASACLIRQNVKTGRLRTEPRDAVVSDELRATAAAVAGDLRTFAGQRGT